MNYEHLKTFYTVCQYKNFSKAAKAMYTSQPAISRVISQMELELGIKLFFRSKEGVRLTKEGEAFYKSIESPFNQLNRLEKELPGVNKILDGVIYLGATVTALSCYLFDLINDFSQKFPKVHYRIYTGSSSSILEMVRNGKIDIAFITTPFEKSDDLNVINVLTIDNVLVGGKKYQELADREISINDLTNYPFILLSNEMQFRTHINDFLNKNNIKIIPDFEADSSSIIMPLVERDYGLAFIPYEMAKESIESNKAFLIKLKEKVPFRYVTMVTSSITNQANIVKEISNYIIKEANNN